ncbi:glycoside hydrolase [Termitidicoccus mucosus]|uniref:Sialidase domain-containing protein n=1 Tax=Termitidicoccus mucosus TaxID=1184151 RepID=A0A178IJ16_9BACT|nr:hypothetical protein AW736_10515 [Opitutaceae bacterium TSB47]
MRRPFILLPFFPARLVVLLGASLLCAAEIAADERITPPAQSLPIKKPGAPCTSIIRLDDGALLTLDGNSTLRSRDNGKTWGERKPVVAGFDTTGTAEGVPTDMIRLIRTRSGALVIVWRDVRKDDWLKDGSGLGPKASGDVWCMRSLDNGATWTGRQRIFDGVCGHPPIRLLQTRSGRLVFPLQYYTGGPLRSVVRTCVSDDDGVTWKMGNIIDLGGRGHHDGVIEPDLIELRDGRIWMLIRTNWDRYWEAFSEDGGLTWRTIRPAAIEASSSPPYCTRLASGRLLLIWNRLHPEGQPDYKRRQPGDALWAETAASWHRDELSAALSGDDGATWSKPVIIARQKDKWLAYVETFEPEPGTIWFFTAQGKLSGMFQEASLLKTP